MRSKTDTLIRSLYYFRNGYGVYLSLPLTIVSFCTTVYYLAIQNIPILKQFFPGFIEFAVALFLIVYPVGVFVGWMHFKKAPFYRVETQIQVESNPYSQTKLAPVMIPLWELFYCWGIKEGLDEKIMADIKRILDASR